MSLRDDIELIIEAYKCNLSTIQHNATLIDIYEGNLLKYIEQDMRCQLSPKSFEFAQHRIAPINLLRKIVDKTSGIYGTAPVRRIAGGVESDAEVLTWYGEHMHLNGLFSLAARMYAMCKSTLIQIYVHNNAPAARVIPNDSFIVLSTDPVDDMSPTHVVTFETETYQGAPCVVFTAYTADEFLIFDEKGRIRSNRMADIGNPEGINSYGALPFIYATSSDYRLYPTPDSDLMRMTRLFPVILSDLNYAVMFQCFSIVYGINLDEEEMTMAPNAFWRLKKDPTKDGDPEIGVVKPQVDYDGVMSLVQSELSLWLNSRGIRPGTVGQLSGDNFQNGISKMIDEMDTYEARLALIDKFGAVEAQFFEVLFRRIHPVLADAHVIDMTQPISLDAQVETTYGVQQPMVSRGTLVSEAKAELDAGFLSRRRAIARLNPMMSDEELDALIAEIDAEQAPAQPEPPFVAQESA